MMSWPFNTCLIFMCFLVYSSALPRAKDYRPEPSCEELRAMWRFSKRQSRAAEITNEIPTYRDPFAFNVWDEYAAKPRSAGQGTGRYRKPVYGKVVHSTSYLRAPENLPERVRAFEEVARLFGKSPHLTVPRRKTNFRFGSGNTLFPHFQIQPSQTGSFQHLKELIRSERARELQEQRLSEQTERNVKELDKIQYGRLNDSPSSISIDNSSRSDRTSGSQNKGIVAFPDILIPAAYKYIDDYLYPASQITMHKYKQRYPDTNSIIDGQSQWAW